MPEILRILICNAFPSRKIRHFLISKLMPEKSLLYRNFAAMIDERFSSFSQNAAHIQTLILGASRAQFDILPFLINPHTFNMGIGGTGLFEHYYVFKKLLSLAPQIQNLILVVSFYNGAHCLVYTKNAWSCAILKRFFDIDYDFQKNKKIDLQTLFQRTKNIKIKYKTSSCQGFDFENTSFHQEQNNAVACGVEKHLHMFCAYQNQWTYLEKIALLCNQKNIRLNVVITPTRADYNALCINSGYDHEKLYQPLKNLSKTYRFRLIDLSKGFQNADFYDATHLNFAGALNLTKRLAQKLKI